MISLMEELPTMADSASILLFGQDTRLVDTRRWVLEKAGFQLHTALSLTDLDWMAEQHQIDLFILCDSLSSELRLQALEVIRYRWPLSQRLVLTPILFSAALEPIEKVFPAMDGPRKLVAAIHHLLANRSMPSL